MAILVAIAALSSVFLAMFHQHAQASSTKTYILRLGDAVTVSGTRINCVATRSNGKVCIGCVLLRNQSTVVGSYGAGLAVDGTAVVTRFKADRSSVGVFKQRSRMNAFGYFASASNSHRYTARIGDRFGFSANAGTSLGCQVINVTSQSVGSIYRGEKVSCWRATATAPIPLSWGISISNKIAGI